MTVKELRALLPPNDDDLTVLARPKAPGYEFEDPHFRIAGVRRTLDPDTAEDIVVLECDQEGD